MEPPVPTNDPPRPPGRKPRVILPTGACDTHCHVFGPWQRFPYVENPPYTPHDVPKEQLFAVHAHLGFGRGIAVQGSPHGLDHSALLDLIASGNGRYRGVGLANESIDDAFIEKLHEGGVRAFRFHTIAHLTPMPPKEFLRDLAARTKPLGWHIVLQLVPETLDLAEMCLGFDIPVLIDHFARIDVTQGLDQQRFRYLLDLARQDKCWIKIGCADRITRIGPPYPDVLPYARALVEAAPDRTVVATDYPHPNHKQMPDDADIVDFIGDVAPDPMLLRRIVSDNPARLYGFE